MANAATQETPVWERMSAFDTLDILSNPVMLADADMVIRHVNEAGYQMFERIEADIRRDLPTFRARDVVGKNIDVFHKNPQHQRDIMADLVKPHDGTFTVGGRNLAFRATPRFLQGTEVGCIFVEWQDRTEIMTAETQLDRLMSDIRKMSALHHAGEIDHFASPEGYEPAFRDVVIQMNDMVGEHIETKKKVVGCLTEIVRGNIEADIESFPGQKAFRNRPVGTACLMGG